MLLALLLCSFERFLDGLFEIKLGRPTVPAPTCGGGLDFQNGAHRSALNIRGRDIGLGGCCPLMRIGVLDIVQTPEVYSPLSVCSSVLVERIPHVHLRFYALSQFISNSKHDRIGNARPF